MPEKVQFDRENGVVEIIGSGTVTSEQMKQTRQQVVEALKSGEYTGLLYDARAIAQAPEANELYDFSKETLRGGRYRQLRLAVLTMEGSDMNYLSLVMPAHNLGQEVMVFADHKQAIHWLKQARPTKTPMHQS